MGKWSGVIEEIMAQLVIASPEDVGCIMSARGAWAAGISATNNSGREMREQADLGRLVKGRGFYRLPSCRSEYRGHAKSLTKSLVKVLIAFPGRSFVLREISVSAIGLRADAIVFLVKENAGFVFILEEINSEREESYQRKRELWMNWPGALEYLSGLFGYCVRSFVVIRSDELAGLLEAAK